MKKISLFIYISVLCLLVSVMNVCAYYESYYRISSSISSSNFVFYSNYDNQGEYVLSGDKCDIYICNNKTMSEDIIYHIQIIDAYQSMILEDDGVLRAFKDDKKTYTFKMESEQTYDVIITSTYPYHKTITYTLSTV